MALIVSKHGNTAFRSEEVIGCFRKPDENDNVTEYIDLIFKSGYGIKIKCKTIEEADATFNNIINAMTSDYDTK